MGEGERCCGQTPSNIAEAVLQSEIRAHLAAMNGNKVSFIDQHAADQRVASAVLGAPAFLSGLTEAELAIVHQRVEQHVSPEVANAKRCHAEGPDRG